MDGSKLYQLSKMDSISIDWKNVLRERLILLHDPVIMNYLTKKIMPKKANKISATGTFAIVGFA